MISQNDNMLQLYQTELLLNGYMYARFVNIGHFVP